MKRPGYILLVIIALYLMPTSLVIAQDKVKQPISFKDSLDHAFDLSDYMIYSNGFVVVPTIITEPSLGGIGGAIIPVFLKKRASITDTVNGKPRETRINPDISGAIGMYTSNKSWIIGAFKTGTFIKPRITYRAALMYADVNLSFFRNSETMGEREHKFNFKTIPLYLQSLKMFSNEKWSAGLQYLFLNTKLKAISDALPSFVTDKEIKSIVSQVGAIIQYDGRDNLFTPDKGMRVQADFFWSDKAIGSDYNSWNIDYSAMGYLPLIKNTVSGIRIEGQQSLGRPPFYLLPSINMRGIPSARYQGNTTLVTEIENRWDFYKRWSLMLYGGAGLAYDNWNDMFQYPVVYSYGTGFRYLLARKFKLRMGADIARGPEKWAYYIVFGSNWFR